jgi:hypothetical protein
VPCRRHSSPSNDHKAKPHATTTSPQPHATPHADSPGQRNHIHRRRHSSPADGRMQRRPAPILTARSR